MDNCIPATPNLVMSQHQTDTIVSLRRPQAKEMLNTLSLMSNTEARVQVRLMQQPRL